jgi:hypothetical protein
MVLGIASIIFVFVMSLWLVDQLVGYLADRLK